MKRSELYKNEFPLEDILPDLTQYELATVVSNRFFETKKGHRKQDFYRMGYEDAQRRIEQVLKPFTLNEY
jgi:hypothetical protein